MARLDRYRIGIPRELSEIRTQPWLSEGFLTCDLSPQGTHLLIARRRNSITSVHIMNDMLVCYLYRQPFLLDKM